jgi:hypothetical protein
MNPEPNHAPEPKVPAQEPIQDSFLEAIQEAVLFEIGVLAFESYLEGRWPTSESVRELVTRVLDRVFSPEKSTKP